MPTGLLLAVAVVAEKMREAVFDGRAAADALPVALSWIVAAGRGQVAVSGLGGSALTNNIQKAASPKVVNAHEK